MTGDRQNIYALLLEPGILQLRQAVLSPDLPRSDYVRIKVAYCGVCGSDLAFFDGRPHAEYPRTLGHEHVGTVVLAGKDVPDFHLGDSVAVDPNYRCGICYYCKYGASNLCESSDANLFTTRGFSTFVDLHASYLHKLPKLTPPCLGGLIEPLSCSLHALDLAPIQAGDAILILGAGSQGSLLSFALSVYFPGTTIDIYDPIRVRSSSLAACFGNVSALKNPPNEAQYSLVFEASGQPEGFQNATRCVQKSGRIVIISRYKNGATVTIPPDFPKKECILRFSNLNGDGEPFVRATELISNHWRDAYNAWIDVRPLEDLNDILKNMHHSPRCKTVIAVDPEISTAQNHEG